MKKLLIIFIILISVQTFGQNYNKEKDVLVNALINEAKILKIDVENYGNYNYVEIYYNNYKLEISHQKYVPYEHKEDWYYSLTNKDGVIILIDKDMICDKNRLSNETYLRLQKLFYKHLNN